MFGLLGWVLHWLQSRPIYSVGPTFRAAEVELPELRAAEVELPEIKGAKEL